MIKVCSVCGVPKDDDQFHRMSASPDGRRPDCKECRRGESIVRYDANKEQINEKAAKRRRESPTPPEYWRKYREDNREQVRRNQSLWLTTDKGRAYMKNREARRRQRIGSGKVTAQEWTEILAAYSHSCAYCGVRFNEENPATQDHVIPLSKGGTHTPDNVVPACFPCNRKKSAKILA